MFKWFQSRKKLLREIKLQEEYIEILRKELDHQLEITGERIRGLEEVKKELAEIRKEWDKAKMNVNTLLEEIWERENIKITQEELWTIKN